MITTLIADDELDVLALLRLILTSDADGLVVAAEAHDGVEAMEQWRLHRPRVVILDQRMPRLTGLEAAAEIREEDPDQVVMLLSAYLDSAEIARAELLGVPVVSKRDILQVPDIVRRLSVRP